MALSYLEFLFIFLTLPIIGLTLMAMLRTDLGLFDRTTGQGLAITMILAVIYTTPWDNLLIEHGVWRYGPETVLLHLWAAPLGEYLFLILQPILAAFILIHLDHDSDHSGRMTRSDRIAGLLAGATVSVIGGIAITGKSSFYLGAILLWAGPVLAIQWAYGWRQLLDNRRTVAAAISLPTLYLIGLDAIALHHSLWTIAPTFTTGISIGIVPIEEAVFFLITTTFVVQSLLLYRHLIASGDIQTLRARNTATSG